MLINATFEVHIYAFNATFEEHIFPVGMVFLTFDAIYNIYKKKFWEYKKKLVEKNNYFSFNVFFVFFFMLEILKSATSLTG